MMAAASADGRRVAFYHRTTEAAAAAIRQDGFRDATACYNMADEAGEPFYLTGVWLSDTPLDENEGACGPVLLRIELPPDLDVSLFEDTRSEDC
jgi:hypothetical protein